MSYPADPLDIGGVGEVGSHMKLEDKQRVLEIITTLRTYQLIGIVEARDWIEFLFPEFATFRDRESDDMFAQLAGAVDPATKD